jgi:hypothetical protein
METPKTQRQKQQQPQSQNYNKSKEGTGITTTTTTTAAAAKPLNKTRQPTKNFYPKKHNPIRPQRCIITTAKTSSTNS